MGHGGSSKEPSEREGPAALCGMPPSVGTSGKARFCAQLGALGEKFSLYHVCKLELLPPAAYYH